MVIAWRYCCTPHGPWSWSKAQRTHGCKRPWGFFGPAARHHELRASWSSFDWPQHWPLQGKEQMRLTIYVQKRSVVIQACTQMTNRKKNRQSLKKQTVKHLCNYLHSSQSGCVNISISISHEQITSCIITTSQWNNFSHKQSPACQIFPSRTMKLQTYKNANNKISCPNFFIPV